MYRQIAGQLRFNEIHRPTSNRWPLAVASSQNTSSRGHALPTQKLVKGRLSFLIIGGLKSIPTYVHLVSLIKTHGATPSSQQHDAHVWEGERRVSHRQPFTNRYACDLSFQGFENDYHLLYLTESRLVMWLVVQVLNERTLLVTWLQLFHCRQKWRPGRWDQNQPNTKVVIGKGSSQKTKGQHAQ